MAHEKGFGLVLSLRLGERVIVIGGDAPYQLLMGGAEGLEAAEAVPDFRENAQLDGSYLAGCRVSGRDITLQFEIADYEKREEHRRALISFFAPGADGELTVTRGSVVRSIGCRLRGRVQFLQETVHHYIRVRVPLYCADPYFCGAWETAVLKKGAAALMTFPLTMTAFSGVTAGVTVTEDCLSLDNRGDTETGFLLTLAISGDEDARMAGPCVMRDGDKSAYVKVLTTLTAGDILQISTVPGRKSVYKNGEPCMLFSRGSRFFALPCGTSTLRITADHVVGDIQASAAFRPRYYGV